VNKLKDIARNLKNVKFATWMRLALLLFAFANQVLTATGRNPLPFSEETVYTGFTLLFTIASGICVFWKNNSFTGAALEADAFLEELRAKYERTDL